MSTITPGSLLEYLYFEKKDRRALNRMYDVIEDVLQAGHEAQSWPWLEEFFGTADVARLSDAVLIGILIATLAVKDRLKARHMFIEIVRSKFLIRHGEEEMTKMLYGLF